ncbi:MAG: DUF4177 domain-containing protein [Pseudomonadota bacterium]
MMFTEFKVVECMTVTDDILEEVLNTWSRKGWVFDTLSFVPNEGSKRPKMAFVIFTRQVEAPDEKGAA